MSSPALGTTQTLAWASSYYLPAILGAPIAAALGCRAERVLRPVLGGAAAVGGDRPYVGRLIDRHGGRAVLIASNLVLAAGLALLGLAQGIVSLAVAWIVLGIGMAMGLYDPAFAALTRLYGREARGAITGITLIAGFASTVGWPATAWIEHAFGWREACLIWAALNLCIAMPLNLLAIPPAPPLPAPAPGAARDRGDAEAPPRRDGDPRLFLLGDRFVTGALAAHLPRFLHGDGRDRGGGDRRGALVGPAQVAARLARVRAAALAPSADLGAHRRRCCTRSAPRCWSLLGPAGAAAFAVLHGAGNGMITIAKGTLPLAIFGPAGYGQAQRHPVGPDPDRRGERAVAVRIAADRVGTGAVLVTAGLCLSAFASLLLLRVRPAPDRALPSAGN